MSFARAERRRQERAAARSQKDQLPAFIDLIDWVKMRANISTRQAIGVIMSGALRVDSHKVGVVEEKGHYRLVRYVPADLRGRIEVANPEILNA